MKLLPRRASRRLVWRLHEVRRTLPRVPGWVWWAAGIAAVFPLYVVAIWRAPALFGVPDLPTQPTPDAALTARHSARLLMVSLGGAVVVGIGLLYTARNYRLSHRGQVTDRFTKALERLGSPELYIRIGGIHALQHVMRDSADHHAEIVEVLVAFIRQRAPRVQNADISPIYPRQRLPEEPDADVQAALTALGHRPYRFDRERGRLALHGLHLHGADLSRGRFQMALLTGAQLGKAKLNWAQLENAGLVGAQLQHADLTFARLQRADLEGADLQRAVLFGADVQETNLMWAQLRSAILAGARLQGADLSRADLHGAYFGGAAFCDEGGRNPAAGLSASQLVEATEIEEARLPEDLRTEVEHLRSRGVKEPG